ncbi:MAG TPA: hypothetical protein VHW23_48575 [Kofleriaceae bacterium]|jgi:hypothetical protein|nr:hypothetical protein [Kofleriaceae bacterium]
MRLGVALVLALAAIGGSQGCGSRATTAPPDRKDAGAGPPPDAAVVEIEPVALGLPEVAAYGWRKRGGQPAFRIARQAEARGDWAAVVTACEQALAADPVHLEASWLYAVGLAKLGKLDQVLAPLSRAAAGDFSKWGQASLELPGMQGFLATAAGAAWRRRVEQDRRRFAEAIARSVIVTAGGELYGVELAPRRWYRLTRSAGVVIGALAVPAAHRIAYVARTRRKGARELGIGVVDLLGVKTWLPIPIGAGPIAVAYSTRPPLGLWIGTGAARAAQWRQLDDEYRLHPLPARTARPAGPWLEVTTRAAHLHALPPDVTADWDDQSLASAIRIGTSNLAISVPSPGLIDGNTAAWSPDRVRVAFVAQLDDHCAAGAVNTAAFVADAATGRLRELERAAGGIAMAWLTDRTLAIAGDRGVAVHSLDDGVSPILIDGAAGLIIPRERPRCAPPEPRDDAGEDTEPAEATAGDEPTDAGVTNAR